RAGLAVDWPKFPVPVTTGASMHAGFPVTVSRAVATPAQGGTINQLQLTAVTGLQQLQICFVVAVETVVIPVMPAVSHDAVLMLFWNHNIALTIQFQLQRLVSLMTDIAIQSGSIATGTHQVCSRLPGGRRADEIGVDQRNGRGWSRVAP